MNVRLNTRTGEVELFQVDDVDAAGRRGADHEAEHDRIAGELGEVMARRPRIDEVRPGAPLPIPVGGLPWHIEEEDVSRSEQERQSNR
ncbi:hypothetical protein [Kitasatospora sp. NPDC056181]|uniref:hypothetical protein n=1 Tax=Kitasatospora sp. NPDC056181 TaxID=3345737 RepID=UPI0035D7C234